MHKTKLDELIEILQNSDTVTSEDLAQELNVSRMTVNRLANQARRRFYNSEGDFPYIYTTGHGYSLKEDKLHVIYESGLRAKMGFGILANGAHVFRRCKRIAPSIFSNLRVEFKPKLLTLNSTFKKEE